MAAVIETEGLTKSYGRQRAVAGLNLVVQPGEVFGLLGPRGAGKTTTIRTMLGHLRPTAGRVRLFGVDVGADPVAAHRRIGYLPGEFTLYDKLTGAQTLDYLGNLRGGVDRAYRDRLIARLDLDPSRMFRAYSVGDRQKLGLIIAWQHEPELLILDEPTSGLEPAAAQTFRELVGEAADAGRTVFLSSEMLSEAEQICGTVAVVRDGRLVPEQEVGSLRDLAVHQVEIRFADGVPAADFAALPDVSDVVVNDSTIRMRVAGPMTPVIRIAARYELIDFVSREPSLEDAFLAEYGASPR